MGPLVPRQNERFTYANYRKWDDEGRWELIEGIPHDMTPAPGRRHQEVSMELSRQFATYLAGGPCRVYAAPFDVRLPEGDEDDDRIATVVQPDISIVCDRSKLDDAGCKGAPDLVVEITSPSTARKDMKEKLVLYERRGVREYWIVEPLAKTVQVFRQTDAGGFGRPGVYAEEDTVKVGIFEDVEIDLSAVFRE